MSHPVQVFSSIVQYVAMQRETNNNNRKILLGPVRCLFGVPDPKETKAILDEELRKQRESFFSRWECDEIEKNVSPLKKRKIEDIENEIENPAKRLMTEENLYKEEILHRTPRRILQPRNALQSHLTDFWSSKKTTCEDRHKQKYPTRDLKQDLI